MTSNKIEDELTLLIGRLSERFGFSLDDQTKQLKNQAIKSLNNTYLEVVLDELPVAKVLDEDEESDETFYSAYGFNQCIEEIRVALIKRLGAKDE